mgnify:CR=1 FL=1
MLQVVKKLPQQLAENTRKVGLQLILLICWAVIILGTFSFLA